MARTVVRATISMPWKKRPSGPSLYTTPYFKANYISLKIFSEKLCLFDFFRLSGLNSFAKVNFHSASPR